MKYLIVKDREDAEHAIVFPDQVIHADVLRIHRASDVRVVAAGFCSFHPQIACWGESESTKFKSRPQDSAILRASFGEAVSPQEVQHGEIPQTRNSG